MNKTEHQSWKQGEKNLAAAGIEAARSAIKEPPGFIDSSEKERTKL
jgi:hypothetical protein